jgi:hypothetical protein
LQGLLGDCRRKHSISEKHPANKGLDGNELERLVIRKTP